VVDVKELKVAMIRKGMNQRQLAEAIGMHETQLSFKMNRGKFSLQDAEKIIRALDIDDPVRIFFANIDT
jgi:DNA-binding Xre family transcriptional regulator